MSTMEEFFSGFNQFAIDAGKSKQNDIENEYIDKLKQLEEKNEELLQKLQKYRIYDAMKEDGDMSDLFNIWLAENKITEIDTDSVINHQAYKELFRLYSEARADKNRFKNMFYALKNKRTKH